MAENPKLADIVDEIKTRLFKNLRMNNEIFESLDLQEDVEKFVTRKFAPFKNLPVQETVDAIYRDVADSVLAIQSKKEKNTYIGNLAIKASIICKVLPYFSKTEVYQKLKDTSEANESLVFNEYIEKAVDGQHTVCDQAFDTLGNWKAKNNNWTHMLGNLESVNTVDVNVLKAEELVFIKYVHKGKFSDELIKDKFSQCQTAKSLEEVALQFYHLRIRCLSLPSTSYASSSEPELVDLSDIHPSCSDIEVLGEVIDVIDLKDDEDTKHLKKASKKHNRLEMMDVDCYEEERLVRKEYADWRANTHPSKRTNNIIESQTDKSPLKSKSKRSSQTHPENLNLTKRPRTINMPEINGVNVGAGPSRVNIPLAPEEYLQQNGLHRYEWLHERYTFLTGMLPDIDNLKIAQDIVKCEDSISVENLMTQLLDQQAEISNNKPKQEDVPNTRNADASHPIYNDHETDSEDEDDLPALIASAENVEQMQMHVAALREMFTDADPEYLEQRANDLLGDGAKFEALVVEFSEKKNYPKLEEYKKRQRILSERKKFIEGMTVPEFLENFEDPEKIFMDSTKNMGPTYISNGRHQLMTDLPQHLSKVIDLEFKNNNFHYLPSLRKLKEIPPARKTKRKRIRLVPEDLDNTFLKELCYVEMQDKIEHFIKNKKQRRETAFERAKEAGQLQVCQCCYDDEVLLTDMSFCENNSKPHSFCNECIRRYAEEQIGQSKLVFHCLSGECKCSFAFSVLKQVLKPSIFANVLKRKQAEEIAAAGIEDLESCPFCSFSTIMPNKEDKVFNCRNPECLKESCRFCKEHNHIPLKCEEVEKKKQTDMRTYLENEMTKAILRECYSCKKMFIKEEGCNKMVCSCGAMMCYLCKKPIKGYGHFHDTPSRNVTGKCALWSNSLKLHADELKTRAEELKKNRDPNVELAHDPTDDIPEVPAYLTNPVPVHRAEQPRAVVFDQGRPVRGDIYGNHPYGQQYPYNLYGNYPLNLVQQAPLNLAVNQPPLNLAANGHRQPPPAHMGAYADYALLFPQYYPAGHNVYQYPPYVPRGRPYPRPPR